LTISDAGHAHTDLTAYGAAFSGSEYGWYLGNAGGGTVDGGNSTTNSTTSNITLNGGDAETRPKSLNTNYFIKYTQLETSENISNRDLSASARKSGNQTITAGAGLTTVAGWAAFNNDVGNFNTTTGVYTFDEARVVNINASAYTQNGATGPTYTEGRLVSSVNGVLDIFIGKVLTASLTDSFHPSINGYKTTRGETIYFQLFATGQNITVLANYGNFSVSASGGNQRIAQSEKVFVEYTGNAGTTITADTTNIDFATKVTDSHSAWNGTTFTAPRNGRYHIVAKAQIGDSQLRYLSIWKNGTEYKWGVAMTQYGAKIDLDIALNGGDYITFRMGGTAGALANEAKAHYLNIHSID
jgi:hypothetical protein